MKNETSGRWQGAPDSHTEKGCGCWPSKGDNLACPCLPFQRFAVVARTGGDAITGDATVILAMG